MEKTFEFTTPNLAPRDPHTLTIDLCGETLELDRPKDFAMRSLATVVADDEIPVLDRTSGILAFLVGTFPDEDYRHFLARCGDRDDPLDLEAFLGFLHETWRRWAEFDEHANSPLPTPPANPPIVITAPEGRGILGGQVGVTNTDLGLDVEFHAPKDILIMIVAALSGGNPAGQQWAIDLFLESTLPRADWVSLKRRLMSSTDPLDSPQMDEIVSRLIEYWSDKISLPDDIASVNREQRRVHGRNNRAPR